jgi:hypothetical protein
VKHDPLLRYFETVDPTKDLTDVSLDDRFPTEAMLARLHSAAEGRPVRKFRDVLWHRTTVFSIVAVLAVTGTAAAISLLRSPVTDTSRLSCYSQISLTSKVIEELSMSSDPLGACNVALHWKQMPQSAAPKGSLCVLANGSLAGFPPSRRADVCSYLKLAAFSGRAENIRIAEFEKVAMSYFGKTPCIAPAIARSEIIHLFAKFELTRWRVRFIRTSSVRACSTLAIQVKDRIVDLVGLLR